jgi:hypothetical protein
MIATKRQNMLQNYAKFYTPIEMKETNSLTSHNTKTIYIIQG